MYQHLLDLLINSFSEALRNFDPSGHYSTDLDGGLLDDLADLNKPLSFALDPRCPIQLQRLHKFECLEHGLATGCEKHFYHRWR
jgi:hypothetical protein